MSDRQPTTDDGHPISDGGQRTTAFQIYARLIVPVEPKTWERPRFNRQNGSVYNSKAMTQAEHELGWYFRQQNGALDPATQAVGAVLRFYTSREGDIDNLVKLVLDSLSKIAYADDKLVKEISARVFEFDKSPRTELILYLVGGAESGPPAVQMGILDTL